MESRKKIAVVLRADLAGWQALNVTAFLASGVAAGFPELIGKPYEDASGNAYLPLFGLPVVVLGGTAEQLARAHRSALERGLGLAVYSRGMFGTADDEANRAVVRALPWDGLDLVGIAVHGSRNAVDKACKGIPLHA